MTSTTTASPRAVNEAQLRGLLAQVGRRRGARLMVVTAAPTWSGPAVLQTDAGAVRVITGQSVLAVRAALVDHPDEFLAVLTPVAMDELGDEVRARAWRQRSHQPSPWDAVRALCKVTAVDPSLRDKRWMVDLLVRVAPQRGYAQPPSQVLDRDTAWRNLYRYGLALDGTPNVRTLLRWAGTSEARDAVARLDDETRGRIAAHLAVEVSPAAVPVVELVADGRGHDALMLGLVVDAVWRDGDAVARTKVQERHLAGEELGEAAADDWARAAVDAVRSEVDAVSREAVGELLRRADTVLGDVAPQARAASAVLDSGFDARLAQLGSLLAVVLDEASPRQLPAAVRALRDVCEHLRAADAGAHARVTRAEAALRLVRRTIDGSSLAGANDVAASGLADLALNYVTEGAWVDAARHRVAEGETLDELGQIYHRLLVQLKDDGRTRDRAFASAVAGEASRPGGATDDLRHTRLLPIEHVVSCVFGPLAEHEPVLLLVIDGLSHAAAVPMDSDLRSRGWRPMGPDGQTLPAVVAALPTVTRVSRASLLCGQLTSGDQKVERAGFGSASALVEAGHGQRPRLFHKSDLGTVEGQVAPEVRDVVGDPSQRVVGVVVNGVDDHLDKGSQLRLADGLDGVPVLAPLLEAAAHARRIVVLTSDHGHILGADQRVEPASGGERFRVTDAPAKPYEVELTGGRVLRGEHRIVAAAEDTVRYIAVAKHGYHGGATPAEALCPLLVMVFGDERIPGWEPLPPQVPRWWDPDLAPVDIGLTSLPDATTDVPAPPAAPTGPAQPSLLDPEPPPPAPVASGSTRAPWITELLASPRLVAQRQLTGRAQLDDDDLAVLLTVLDSTGNRASGVALQRTLDLPATRLRSKLGAARGLLNVDGYTVLRVETDGTAVLDPRLLAEQFGLASLGGPGA